MKFYNVISQQKQKDINKIIDSMSNAEIQEIDRVLKTFDFVEYTNEKGNECMFAIMSDSDLIEISRLYNKYGLDFEVIDLSQKVFFDISFRTRYKDQYLKNAQHKIEKLIHKFKSEWTTPDIVLDKILEMGVENLTEFDLEILKLV